MLDTVKVLTRTPPTLESNSFIDVPAFTVVVPCGTKHIYQAAENWSVLTITQKCNKPNGYEPFHPIIVGIDDVEESLLTAVAVEGGLYIELPNGYDCTVRDMLGRVVATLRNPGFVPLKNNGVYLVGIPALGKTIKVVFSN